MEGERVMIGYRPDAGLHARCETGVETAMYIAAAASAASAAKSIMTKPPKGPDLTEQNALLAKQSQGAQDERDRMAAEQMARARAGRAGMRGLLSDTRANAEGGLATTLGPAM